MTFQEWLQTEAGRMVSFDEMPRMLEIVWNASAAAAEKDNADLRSTLRDEILRAEDAEAERDELRAKFEQAQRRLDAYDKADRALNQALNEGDGVYRS